jgi:hypothetical protein
VEKINNSAEEIKYSAEKTEIKQKKGLKSIKEKLKNSLRFANRLDVLITEY